MSKIEEQNILDNTHVTANSEQIAVLKKHFPNCFDKDGNFLVDKLSEIVKKDGVDLSHEGYKLDWLGKSYARLLANEKPCTFITPDVEHNAKAENKVSNNLLIKGDNLEVLKHLKNAYTEAVKVIYIDPPYNTGSDGFVYQDDRKFTKEELAKLANVSEEDAERILNFTDRGSNSHSAWLTFIYPRLYVARELLREDGVIFISIDDNEQAQLKLLCDEVFGEENYISLLSVQLNPRGRNLDKFIAKTHESLMIYAKKSANNTLNSFEKDGKMLGEYNKEDQEGKYRLIGLRNRNQSFNPITRPKLYYPVYVSKHGQVSINQDDIYVDEVYPDTPDGIPTCWTWGIQKFIKENHLLIAEKSGQEWRVYRKDYLNKNGEVARTLPKSIWLDKELNNDYGKQSIKDLFGENIMSFPKSPFFMEQIIKMGSVDDSLILDFFAGSGTTGQAVMDLNANDGGNRQYILVQLPEETDKKREAYKAGYNTIFDITKARIEKAAEKIRTEKPDYEGDLGFKIFETQALPENYIAKIEKLTEATQGKLWDGSSADDELLRAILTTWTLYDRILLTTDLQTIELSSSGYKTYYGEGKESNTLYLMHKGFTIDNVKDIIEKLDDDASFTPKKIVIYGHNFDSKSQRELSEALHNYKNKKGLELDIIKRY